DVVFLFVLTPVPAATVSIFFIDDCAYRRVLHSFPTRRSSDLGNLALSRARRLRICGVKAPASFWKLIFPVMPCADLQWANRTKRSEEHTLNSSHRTISYAVFCLKKKKECNLTHTG